MGAQAQARKYSVGRFASDPAWRVAVAIGPSRRALAWLAVVASAALAATMAADLPAWVRAAVAVAIGVAAVRAARRDALCRGPASVRRLVVDLSARVEIERADGRWQSGKLVGASFVAPWLTLVRWRPEGARLSRTIVVVPDAVDEEAFRRLRILLRWR